MRCVICLTRHRDPIPLCHHCRSLLPLCDWTPDANIRAPFAYEFPLTVWIHQFKFQGQPGMATWLGRLLATYAPPHSTTDAVIPVPMHPARLRERGFNQSTLLAKQYARLAGVPFYDLLVKNKVTTRQRGLDRWERRRNLVGSFSLSADAGDITGKHIVVIDDVVTTGSTGNAVSGLLYSAGASSVTLTTLACAMPRDDTTAAECTDADAIAAATR